MRLLREGERELPMADSLVDVGFYDFAKSSDFVPVKSAILACDLVKSSLIHLDTL